MKIKTIIIVLGMLLPILSIRAQGIKPLSIGDTVPDLELHNVINYKDSVIRLSDFKDKPVILDFFATWCGSCAASLRGLDSLQQRLKDSIRILVVCYEPKEKIQSFLSRQRLSRYRHLAFVAADSLFQQLFPHDILPHEVWIGKNRRVFNTTDALAVNYVHVSSWLKTGHAAVETKVDRLDYDRKKSILTLGRLPVVSQRVLTRQVAGIPSGFGIARDSVNHTRRIYYHNLSLEHLLRSALSFPYTNRTLWDTAHRKRSPDISPYYCYETTLSDTLPEDYYKKDMLEDICHAVGIAVSINTVETPCYRFTSIAPHQHGTDTPSVRRTEDAKDGPCVLYSNWEAGKLVQYLDCYSTVPVVDGTPKGCRISLKFHTDHLDDYKSLRHELKTQGWDLKLTAAKLAVMVIKNTN